MNNKTALLVGSQHGDETLGQELLDYISYNFPQLLSHIEYLCANPRAHKEKVRFIDSDMNRSYNLQDTHPSYEIQAATDTLKYIQDTEFDFILDIHTTTTDVGLCFITTDKTDLLERFVSASLVKNIVHIPKEIGDHSLIGSVSNSISIECNDKLSKKEVLLHELAMFVSNLIDGKTTDPQERYVYYVDSFIKSGEDLSDQQLHNFERANNGKYPVLYGGKPGRTYHGFWANKRKTVVL